MIFSELYSAYYNAVAAILSALIEDSHSEKDLQAIVSRYAFGESVLTILPSLKSEKWQLVSSDMTTVIGNKPTMPLTLMQKRWLKAISLDRRVKLFDIDFPSLEGVEPLFTPEDYYIYDQYADGDPYEDEEYIRRFRLVHRAILEKRQIKFEMLNRKGRLMYVCCAPLRLEYSAKDDKFRVVTGGCRFVSTVNIARMLNCNFYTGKHPLDLTEHRREEDTLTVKLTDERNALERFMLHFAHFEKSAEKLDKSHYLIKIRYALDDEPEMVIRVLSFGPLIEVVGSESFKKLVIEKLKKQLNCGLK